MIHKKLALVKITKEKKTSTCLSQPCGGTLSSKELRKNNFHSFFSQIFYNYSVLGTPLGPRRCYPADPSPESTDYSRAVGAIRCGSPTPHHLFSFHVKSLIFSYLVTQRRSPYFLGFLVTTCGHVT